ncbi:Ser/Thr protein kinase RdoA involved in Cpx stress response, MazF antagonist [Meinhardsimonia xiamenensis]|jgi:Ser/Thr protein kinase RdoA (MazF antagonist)|uniref:Ser/Thr protein kinase RdoA involved in Cpx stress response, MazF antagonist n=1 Tax=Meinhardsimonia xiamenensis TaxID=990712 RepID=A0A1G9F3J6_9RHOB|nr:phosphotransferase [Meinhardsimonia xiamenensis]PRX38011.1 Ser/Thr protein kinase RdoA (MazF antagonist) [Meinhardsimonia xiamenensis]SDK82984.1 Ser/Thr protein kinase RdoA involved in Cpx stress response, MazF antagonist [Meinhardsimonia xiamenensis]
MTLPAPRGDAASAPLDRLANEALALWDLPPGAAARLINLSENATYLVEAPGGWRSILRVHREGYHSRRAIECELAWARALSEAGAVETAPPIPGRDGALVQSHPVPGGAGARRLVMFEHLPGTHPDERGDLVPAFRTLGEIAARTHLHAISWARPEPFERLRWDERAVFGPEPIWGDWRAAPNVTPAIAAVLERLEATLRRRLAAYGKGAGRFGLIHADMRLANLLIEGDSIRLIDFDDCGFGWFLYDFAAAVSFIEDNPALPALKAAWLDGYRRLRPLPAEEEAEIDSFVMLRRMALLAWIGSHIEAPEPQALAPHFAAVTAELAEAWLTRNG